MLSDRKRSITAARRHLETFDNLTKLEAAGFVVGRLELSADGKALKYFEATPFVLTIDLPTISAAAALSPISSTDETD